MRRPASGSLFTRDLHRPAHHRHDDEASAHRIPLFAAVQGSLGLGHRTSADALNYTAGLDRRGRDFGDLNFDLTLLRTLENQLQVLDEQPTNPLGTFVHPKWKSHIRCDLQDGMIGAYSGARCTNPRRCS